MLCQCSSRSFATLFKPSKVLQAARKPQSASSIRTFSSLPYLRPTVFSSGSRRTTMQKTQLAPGGNPSTTSPSTITAQNLDLLPKISSHPALGGLQVRCGPRNTFSPSHFVRKRRHGFLSRQKTRKGRATLVRRRLKKRSTLSH